MKIMNVLKAEQEEQPLHIAMIGHKRIPSREGGVEIVVEELATRLVERGHRVTAYNRTGNHVSGKVYNGESHKHFLSRIDTYKGIQIVNVLTINRKGIAALTSSITATVAAVCACIRKSTRFDCIHYHAEGPSAMLWLPHLLGIKTVVTIHGLDWQRAKWGGFATKYLKFGEKMAAKYADEVIVLSKNVQEYFRETYNRETIFISNGIEKPEIREANEIKVRWNLVKDSYILFLGRIVPEKGIHYLIEAFKGVNTDKKLVIAGGASGTEGYVGEIKQLVDGDERIIFTDFVQGTTLQELYSNSYVYCLPSDLEGMPISLLEGMSYGNCCIVSDIAECAEVVEDKALVFKKGDVDELRAMLQLCCDDSRMVEDYRKLACDFILRKYNWEAVVEKTSRLYGMNKSDWGTQRAGKSVSNMNMTINYLDIYREKE